MSLVSFFKKIWSGGRIIVLLQWNGTCQNNWSLSPTFMWDMFKISTVIFAHFAFYEWCFFSNCCWKGLFLFCWKSVDENSINHYFCFKDILSLHFKLAVWIILVVGLKQLIITRKKKTNKQTNKNQRCCKQSFCLLTK